MTDHATPADKHLVADRRRPSLRVFLLLPTIALVIALFINWSRHWGCA